MIKLDNVAAVFPGQGSQSINMGKELFDNFKIYKETLEEASDCTGVDFKKLCFEGPAEDLQLTENTQPAIVTSSVGAFRVLKSEFDFKPNYVAGHSVGEYSALVASDVITFQEAVKAVKLRGKSMQDSVPVGEGAMAALLGPTSEQVLELSKWVESQNKDWVLQAANFNCPGQVVISGSAEAVAWLKENISGYTLDPAPRKVRLIPLKVSAPFHCRLMEKAQETMKEHLNSLEFKAPTSQLIQNTTAKVVTSPDEIRENLIKQVSGSVLWQQSIETLKNNSVVNYIEVGSGSTLSGLIKKIDSSDLSLFNTNSLEELKKINA